MSALWWVGVANFVFPSGETVVCTEDPKRSIGLWHCVMAAAYCGLHVVYVPPNVMTTLPTAWLHMIHKHKATCAISSSRALSGCISLASHKELRDLSLDTVRMLLLDDGANPCEWERLWVWLRCMA